MTATRTGRMSTEERTQLADLAAQGLTAVEIAIAMNRSFGTINSHLNRRGVAVKHKYIRWTPDQDRLLQESVRKGKTDAAIGALVGRTGDAVHARISMLGGRALMLYPAGPSTQLPLPAVKVERATPKADPYHLWTRANARMQARQEERT